MSISRGCVFDIRLLGRCPEMPRATRAAHKCKDPDKTMPSPKSAGAMVPPDFVRDAYLHDLPQDLAAPLQLLFALRNCVQRVNADLVKWLGRDALSPGRMQMLMILRASPEPVAQRDLVAMLGVSRASVSELVETLVRDGLASSRPDAGHRRRMRVALTPSGRMTADRLLQDNAARLRESFAGFEIDELQDLVRALGKLCARGGEQGP